MLAPAFSVPHLYLILPNISGKIGQICVVQGQIITEFYHQTCHFPQISGISSSINVLNIRTYSKYIWPSIPQIFGLTVLITINIQVALHPLFL